MRVGFIGLGTMGAGMAGNLAKAGNELVVHDMNREAAEPFLSNRAIWADSPKAVAEQVDVVFLSLPGPPEVRAVATGADGLVEGLRPGGAVFDLSTNSPTAVRDLHAIFAEKGFEFLDAPVSGGPAGAHSGKLALWVGGAKEVFEKYKSQLDAMGDQAAYIGEIGAGSIAKLVHNCAGYTVQAALGEVFTLGIKAGVEPLDLWEAVRQGVLGRRRTFDGMINQFLPGVYEPAAFALRLAHKDVSLATALGREMGVPMRIANLTLEEMTEALNRGWGNMDSRVSLKLQLERSGVEVAVDPARLKAALERDPPI
ncbi:MAG: NAD(P)-dependent oxidoreductase [Alphaproteobacteria bacterium]|jgi:3-hydroxyisobutyrate dehydrogenase-like beta-hydroxyacid dehydrogenase|nr:NAD(P)-dependent oxidoreductase [Alphaproteobacteria bacterium]